LQHKKLSEACSCLSISEVIIFASEKEEAELLDHLMLYAGVYDESDLNDADQGDIKEGPVPWL
jgi:predicted CopG family antitoxin